MPDTHDHDKPGLDPTHLRALLDLLAKLAGERSAELGLSRESWYQRWTGEARALRDDRELNLSDRLWLVTRSTIGQSLYLSEVHPLSRLLRSCSGLEYLAPPERIVIGVAVASPDLLVPSPAEAGEDLAEQLRGATASSADRSERWRILRLQRQSVRAAGNPRRWALFCVRNDLVRTSTLRLAVSLSDGQRALRVVDPGSGAAVDADHGLAQQFWSRSEFGPFAAAIRDCALLGAGAGLP